MALSPSEIETKQFVTVMRGFDPNEVKTFLGRVAEEMRGLLRALYAALPPAVAIGETPDPYDLVDHGSAVATEIARLAEAGRSAQLVVAALRRQAELDVQEQHLSATEHLVTAVREGNQLIVRARAEIEALEQEHETRRRLLVDGLSDLGDQLGQGERMLRELRTTLRSTSGRIPERGA